MAFSENLVHRRKALGLSQEELAGKLQVSRQAVSKWETGDAMPDLPNLLALAEALSLSLDALCGRQPQHRHCSEPVLFCLQCQLASCRRLSRLLSAARVCPSISGSCA